VTNSPAPDPLAPLAALPGVADALEEAREAIAGVHRHQANRRGWATSAAEASLRAARSSAALAGAQVRLGTEGEVEDPILAGALRLSGILHGDGLDHATAVWTRAPLQQLARMHTLAAAGLVDPDGGENGGADGGANPGGAVTEGTVGGARLDLLGRPRAEAGVSERLQGLADLITGGTSVAAPVLAAVVHGELASLRPFGTADGVVARAASRLVSVSTGLDPRGLGVPEVLWNRDRARYESLLAGFATGTADGLGAWILYQCEAIVEGAREAKAIADAAG